MRASRAEPDPEQTPDLDRLVRSPWRVRSRVWLSRQYPRTDSETDPTDASQTNARGVRSVSKGMGRVKTAPLPSEAL